MTTIEDLGAATGTKTEWAVRHYLASGDEIEDHVLPHEDRVRWIAAFDQRALEKTQDAGRNRLDDGSVDIAVVRRTVTTYVSGHVLTGPWEVAE